MDKRAIIAVGFLLLLVGGGAFYETFLTEDCSPRLTVTEFDGDPDPNQTVQFTELNRTMQGDFKKGLNGDGTVVVGDRIDHWDDIETVTYDGQVYSVGQGQC